MSPDNVTGYPRWQGELSTAPRFWTIAKNELILAYRDRWVGYAFVFFLVLSALRLAGNTTRGGAIDDHVEMLKVLDWAGLAVAAIMSGPALFDDARRGALELYFSRGASRMSYLAGKAIAVFTATFIVVAGPALIYYGSSFIFSETHPANWGWVWLGTLGHAALWAFMIAGLGLALSAALRSAAAASVVLFGVVFGLDLILSNLMELLTRDPTYQLMSPVADLAQQGVWLFPGATAPYAFPSWWSLLVLVGLAVIGWGVLLWRAPRLKGVE